LDQRLAIHGLPGEIFRLDSPTYVREAVRLTSSDDASEDSGPQGSFSPPLPRERNLLNGGDEAVSPQPVSDSVSTARNPRGDHSKAIEENLRRARVRVFNPVWEVDSLQWPEVCLALLEKRAESMEKVAHNLISACQEGLQVLAVTSPQSGEGRTTVACCLAKLAGSRGLKVAIVDGDIENPSLSYQTNLDVEQDWKTAIFNQIPLEEIAVHSIDDQVTLVPLLRPIAHNEMSADDNRIAYMLYELAESFDLVVVDMGHMSSARSLVTTMGEQGILNAVVAVVDHRSSSPEQIETCLRRIRACGVASIGLVENFAA
jgi:Mrp family chromosome partitioning ATPase